MNGSGLPALAEVWPLVLLFLSESTALAAGPTFLRFLAAAFAPSRARQDRHPCECRPGFQLRGPGDYEIALVQQQTRPAPILFWPPQHSFALVAHCRVASECQLRVR